MHQTTAKRNDCQLRRNANSNRFRREFKLPDLSPFYQKYEVILLTFVAKYPNKPAEDEKRLNASEKAIREIAPVIEVLWELWNDTTDTKTKMLDTLYSLGQEICELKTKKYVRTEQINELKETLKESAAAAPGDPPPRTVFNKKSHLTRIKPRKSLRTTLRGKSSLFSPKQRCKGQAINKNLTLKRQQFQTTRGLP